MQWTGWVKCCRKKGWRENYNMLGTEKFVKKELNSLPSRPQIDMNVYISFTLNLFVSINSLLKLSNWLVCMIEVCHLSWPRRRIEVLTTLVRLGRNLTFLRRIERKVLFYVALNYCVLAEKMRNRVYACLTARLYKISIELTIHWTRFTWRTEFPL